MALIDCPECRSQVSDRAPTCPHCGLPIADAVVSDRAAQAPPAATHGVPAKETRQWPDRTETAAAALPPTAADVSADGPSERIELFQLRLAGRPLPVAGALFWGGMVLGVGLKYLLPTAEGADPEPWRRLPWVMIWSGVLWFTITEFGALIRDRLRKR